MYVNLHFEKTQIEYDYIFQKLNQIQVSITGSKLFATLIVTDAELALVNSVELNIDFIFKKSCLFHLMKNIKSDFYAQTESDLKACKDFLAIYYCIRALPYWYFPKNSTVKFLKFLLEKYQDFEFYPLNQTRSAFLREKSQTLITKYLTRFENDGERLSWQDILSQNDRFQDCTTNALECSNLQYRRNLELSMKTRCIDIIMILRDFLYFRSMSYIANYKDQKRQVDENAQIKHYIRKKLIDEFRIRNNKNIDFSRIFNIIVKDLFNASPLADEQGVEV